MPLVLRLLGRFELATGSDDPVVIKGAHAQLLLARLSLADGGSLDRGVLCSLHWGDRADTQARASLRQLIWTIRLALERYPDALVADGAAMRLNPTTVRSDVTDFDRLSLSRDLAELEQALALYRGDLLEGIDLVALAPDGYFMSERTRLHDRALQVVGALIEGYRRDGQLELAMRAARRGLMLDPFDGTLHGHLFDLLQQLGRHREARDQDEAFRTLMKAEFGMALAPRTLPVPSPLRAAAPPPAAMPVLAPVPSPGLPSNGGQRWTWQIGGGIAAIVLMVGLGIGAWRFEARGPGAAGEATAPSVLVFPFRDISVGSQQPEYAAALTADLVTDLSRVSGIFLMANQPDTDNLTDQGAVEVARRMGVDHAVIGSVRRSHGMIRTNIALIDADTGQHQWAANYDSDLSDQFQVQDGMVRSIVASLEVQLKGTEIAAIERIPTKNLEAYDQYMRAEEQRLVSTESDQSRRVLAAYRRAIALDPEFAEAHAGYARAVVEVWQRSSNAVMPGIVARQEAYEAAGRALQLDPGNTRALVVLSRIQVQEGAHDSALTSARRAVAAQPNDVEARANLALILSYAGAYAEATAEMKRARQLDPSLHPELLVISGKVAFADARYDDAIADFRAAWPALSRSETVLEHLAAALALQGRIAEAATARDQLLSLVPITNLHLFQAVYAKLYVAEHYDRLLEGMRLAGVPDWPHGFHRDESYRLTGADLAAVATSAIWSGQLGDGNPFQLQADEKGAFAYRTNATLLTGRQFVRDGKLCQLIANHLIDGEICGLLYRAVPGKDPESDFVFVSLDGIKYFSLLD